MNSTDKDLWIFLNFFTLFILLFTAMYFISSYTKEVELTLNKGEEISVKLFRLSPHNISLSMRFSRNSELEKKALGNWRTIGDWKKTGALEFLNPGEPIKVLLSNKQQNIVYEAMPKSATGRNFTIRDFMPYIDDGNPNTFPWGTNKTERFGINSGFNEFKIKILNIGKSLDGKKVALNISPALGFKTVVATPLYSFLWFFHFWPIYWLFLSIFYLILLFRKWNRQELQHTHS